ncbi:citrate synthase, partial [Irineochytrium annulatum]
MKDADAIAPGAIREFDGKLLLAYWLPRLGDEGKTAGFLAPNKMAHLNFEGNLPVTEDKNLINAHVAAELQKLEIAHPWLLTEKLVCKPDQLIKRRGKNGLLGINLDWAGVKEWIGKRAGQRFKLERTSGLLNTFLIEPFVPHPQDTEFYICIQSERDGDMIFFTHEGGVDVGDVDAKAKKLLIP